MNTGLQDAFNLGWKLASVLTGKARQSVLKSYDAERVPVAEQLLTGTDRAYRFVLQPGELMKRAVRTFGPFLMSLHTVQEKAVSTLEEIKIAYHGGPLTEDHGGSNGPVAGERMLDAAAVLWPDLRTEHLFDIVRGTKWSAILFAGTDSTPETLTELANLSSKIRVGFSNSVSVHLVLAEGLPSSDAQGVLLDREHFLHDKYGVKNSCLYLIRPDWYIGFRGRLKDSVKLMEYLEKNLIANTRA
jgi:3-(3-hydroxy-phenyl)propionate hydroxylase